MPLEKKIERNPGRGTMRVMVEGERVKDLIQSVMEEYEDSLLETSARISRETGLHPVSVRNCYHLERMEYKTYRLISIVLIGNDPGPPVLHPEAGSIMLSHDWEFGDIS
jgi:hypothetical protein